jgi:hypothetical protein
MFTAMGTENAINMFVFALAKQMQIEITNYRAKPVRVLPLLPVAMAEAPTQLILRCVF